MGPGDLAQADVLLMPSKFINKYSIIYSIHRAALGAGEGMEQTAKVCRKQSQTTLPKRTQGISDTAALGLMTIAQGEQLGLQKLQP